MMRWVFGADTAPFRKGLDDMRGQTKAFAGSLKGMLLGAIGIGAIVNGFKNLFVEMDRIQKLALRFGESAESIQKVGFAAGLAGSTMEGVAKSLAFATKGAYDAANGVKKMDENFAALGINASEFVNMSMEDKLLVLANALNSGAGAGENLAKMMSVIGKSGGELIPLLSQGQEELQNQFDNTSTVSQSTVDSIAKFNDSIEALKQKAQVAGGEIVNVFRLIFEGFGQFVATIYLITADTFSAIVNSAKATGDVIGKALKGDFEGAGKAAKRFGDIGKELGRDFKNTFKTAKDGAKEMWDSIYGGSGQQSQGGPDIENIQEQAEAALKVEEEKKKLMEEIAKLKEEAAQSELSLAEKILALEERRAKLAEQIDFLAEEDTLKEQKELLEGEKELKKLREEQAKINEDASKKEKELAAKAAEEEERKAEDLRKVKEEEKNVDRDIAFNALDDEGKVAMLKKEKAALMAASGEAGASGNEEEAIRLRTEAKLKGSEISDLLSSSQSDNGPTIAASSLAAIGAGGSANLLGNGTLEQRKVSLLEQIAANTGRTDTGSAKIPEPV